MRSLFVNDRFYYAMAGCVAVFIISYFAAPAFYAAVAMLAAVATAALTEIAILYSKRRIKVTRRASAIFSLHDANEVTLLLENAGRQQVHLRVVDEIPYQF